MTVRMVVSCDSDPARYAPDAGNRCRAWLPCTTADPTGEAIAKGWSYLLRYPTRTAGPVFVHRCPSCTRAVIARATHAPQEQPR